MYITQWQQQRNEKLIEPILKTKQNAFEFHDLDKGMSNIPDGSTEKSNHEMHKNFVIFELSIVETIE